MHLPENLESRLLFHLELISALPSTAVAPGTAMSEINLSQHFDNENINGTIVRFNTDLGDIDIEMFNTGSPQTVSNFLGYVTRGDYNNTYFHRAVNGFVVQGGGYSVSTLSTPAVHIPEQAPVVNEFNPARSNVRGTIAMAKIAGNPNSATSEFFFNVSNNDATSPIANLDAQNGGFTVFGKVINNTIVIVDTIDGLPKFQPDEVPFEDLPLQGTPPAMPDNVVKLRTASVIPEAGVFSYTVQSSDPGLVTPVVENGVLRLMYGAGAVGTAEITVTATDAEGTVAMDSFSAGIGELNVDIGTGGTKAATFTDADGTVSTIALKGGSGTLRFGGSNLSQTAGRNGTTIQGAISDLAIDLTGTGTIGALTVKASGGDGLINVTRLTSDGGMKSIGAKQVNLVGDLTIAGNVGKADFANITNSTMSFGGSGGGLALTLRNAEAVEIISQIPIKSLKAESFAGGGPDSGAISAPGIGSLTVNGDFNQRLDIAGGLGSAKIGGMINTFLPWSIGGAAGKLAIGSIAEGFVGDFFGPIASLAVTGNLTGDISAASIKSLTVKGDVSSANLILTGTGVSLGRATVSGTITNSRIQATDSSIGSVTAAAINASTIYAGVNTDGGALPVSLSDFGPAASSIASVTVKNKSGPPSFVNANIAARSLGRLSLGVVQVGNAGVPFGVAADAIAAVSGTGDGPLKFSKLSETADTIVQQDFTIRVL